MGNIHIDQRQQGNEGGCLEQAKDESEIEHCTDDYVLQLGLERSDQLRTAGLCLTTAKASELRCNTQAFLHPHEQQRFRDFSHKKRADDYVRGRYAAKQAIKAIHKQHLMETAKIESGIFRQPLLSCPFDSTLEVSLSHSASISAAIAYPGAHPMAIDVENVDPESGKELATQVSTHEKALFGKLSNFSELEVFTGLWTIKEALSKVMRCGLTAPISIFDISDYTVSGHIITANFSHFMQYKALCFPWLNCMCSIVLPRNTELLQQSELALQVANRR